MKIARDNSACSRYRPALKVNPCTSVGGHPSIDGKQVIGFFQPDKEEFLEYDVASMIYKLANPKRPTIGLISALPMEASFDQRTGQMREGWAVLTHLREMYTVQSLQPDIKAIEKSIDVLLVVHPKDLSPTLSYAIDQFVMRGGKLMAFVDPMAEQDASGNPMAGATAIALRRSVRYSLLGVWTTTLPKSSASGVSAVVSTQQGQPPSRHLPCLRCRGSSQ